MSRKLLTTFIKAFENTLLPKCLLRLKDNLLQKISICYHSKMYQIPCTKWLLWPIRNSLISTWEKNQRGGRTKLLNLSWNWAKRSLGTSASLILLRKCNIRQGRLVSQSKLKGFKVTKILLKTEQTKLNSLVLRCNSKLTTKFYSC